MILGKNCICGCEGNGKLCGGIDSSVEAQQKYLETLISREPSLIVLSASSAMFFPEDDTEEGILKKEKAQLLYKTAEKNMIEACAILNGKEDSPYRFEVIKPDANLKFIATNPKNENGYMVVAYDTRKVNFQLTTTCLEKSRQREKIEDIRSKVSVDALIGQRRKIAEKVLNADKENLPPVEQLNNDMQQKR